MAKTPFDEDLEDDYEEDSIEEVHDSEDDEEVGESDSEVDLDDSDSNRSDDGSNDDDPDSAKPSNRKKRDEVFEFGQIAIINPTRPHNPKLPKNHYFDNDYVEKLLTEYVKGGCTDINLRNEIMSHASELIRQVIRTHKLHTLTSGKDGTAFGDLYQLGYCQIEQALYKFDFRPGHTKVFNLFSQVAKTVMLAYIKKESRDRRNYMSYKEHLAERQAEAFKLDRFFEEATEICQYNDDHMKILKALKKLFDTDDKPHENLVEKLVEKSKTSKAKVISFIRTVRLRSLEFSDSPINNRSEQIKHKITENGEGDDD